MHKRLVENLPAIIRESVKPMEKITEIKIMHVDGLPGFSRAGGPAAVAEARATARRRRAMAIWPIRWSSRLCATGLRRLSSISCWARSA